MTPATGLEVTAMLEVLGSVVTWLFSQIVSLVDLVLAQPLLLIPIGIILTYSVISVFKRIF